MKRTFTFLWVTLLCCIGMVKADVTDLPQITTDLENPIYYTIYNTRSSQPGGLMYYAGDAVGLKDGCSSLGNEYKFFFTGSHDALYIHNAATTNKLASVDSWTAEGTEWAVGVSPKGNGLAIGPKGGLDGDGCINEKNYGTGADQSDFTTWSANDDGSIFVMELAEGYVFPMTDLFYVIECPLFEKVQGVKKALYVNAEGNAAWATEDLADLNYYWIPTVKEDGTVALKNLGADKYLSNTAGAMSVDAVYAAINALGANSFNIKFDGNVLHANGHGSGNSASGGLTSWGGAAGSASAWKFVQREDPTKLQEADVTYNLTYGDEVKYTQTVTTLVGEEWPAITVALPYTVSATKPEGVIAAEDLTDGAVTKEIALTIGELPFVAAADVESIDTWYYVKMHSNTPKYIQYLTDQTYLEWADAEKDETAKDTYAWTFVGNIFDGFKVVNKAAAKAMQSTADGAVVLVDYADASQYVLAATRETTEAAKSGFCLRRPDANKECLNASEGKVAHWWDNDAGSTFMLEVVENEPELPEEPEGDEADYDLSEGHWFDATDKVKNANLASLEGWTCAWKTNYDGGRRVMEFYAGWGALEQTSASIKQNVDLLAGTYRLSGNAFFRYGRDEFQDNSKSLGKLVAGDNFAYVVPQASEGNPGFGDADKFFYTQGKYNVGFEFTLDAPATVAIGYEAAFEEVGSWFVVGALTLEKKQTLKDNFMEQAAAFTAFGQSSMALQSLGAVQEKWAEAMAVVDPLYGALAEGGKALKTEVVAAMVLMTTTMAEIKPVVEYYDGKFTDAKWAMYDIQENSTANSDEVRAAFDDALAAALNVSAVTTVAELEAKVAEMEAARQTYVLNAVPAEGFVFDYTFKIVNPDFNSNIDGWTCVKAQHNGGAGYDNVGGIAEIAEWGASSWDASITQTLTNLPNGKYIVKAAWMAASGIEMTFVANEGEASVTGIGDTGGNIDNDGNVVEMGQGFRGWQYVEVEGVVVDGTLTITVNSSSTTLHTWSNADAFELYYAGTIVEEPEQPEVDPNDYTSYIINADLATGDAWNTDGTKGIANGYVKVSSGSIFDFCQTITLPAGQYKMTAKAAYRYGGDGQAEYDAIKAGTDTHLAKLYAVTATYKYEGNVMNRYEGASETDLTGGAYSTYFVNNLYVPNASDAVKAWFDAGQYVNELVFNVQEDGEVKIGIANAATSPIGDYTNIGAWTLTRLGDAEADPTPEPEPEPEPDPTPDPEKPEIGDVTSKYLVNADFETASAQNDNAINTPPGWTLKHETSGWLDGSTRASTNPGGDGSQCYNLWAQTVSLADIYQTVTLPAGKYKLTVGLYSDGDAERYAYATVGGNTIKSANAKVGSWDFVSVEFSNPTEGEVTLGAVSKGWFQIDNVTLEYTGEVGKDDFVNAYNHALGEAQALVDQKMSAVAAAQLEATIAAYGSLTADNSIEELEAATDAILAELVSVKVSVNSYKVLAVGTLPDNSLEGWTCTNSNTFHINTWSGEGNSDGTNMVTPFIENWVGKESLLGNGKISYTLPGVDPGYYKVSSLIRVYSEANNDIAGASFFANEVKTDFATGKPFTYNNMKGIYDVYTAVVNVGEEGTLEFGVEIENATFNWVAFKNVKIEYIGVIDQAAAEVLKSKIPTTKYDAALTAEVEALVAAIDAGVTYENYLALSEKVALAETSAAAYAANKTAIDGMFTLMASTNVYTAEAFAAYSAKAEDFLAQYEAGTLNATVDNPLSIHGWHATADYCEMLLSAFGIAVDDWANLHVNTWSTEGEADGSDFKVPFYEYWTGDDQSLGVATKTATITGLTPGMYYTVEAWVRVRAKNGVAATDATGITLSVGNGEAVDLTEGEVIGTSQFSHAIYKANGPADAEGTLTINFNILEGNNVSWLSFKNMKYVENPEADPSNYTSAIVNANLSTGDAWNTEGTKGISGGMVKVASESAFDFSQTITLPAGQYKMTAKAVYRYTGSEAEEFAAIEAGTKTRLVNLYAETATYKYEAGVMNRYDGASDTDYAAGNGSVSVNGKFVPNSSAAVQTWFDNGQYVNELVFNVQEEGQIKIGITRTGSIGGDYTNIGAWTLTRLGDAEADPVVEPEYLTVVGAKVGDVAIVEGAATVESISSFEITFDRPVALAEDAEWAVLTDSWGDNALKAEVLEDNNSVVRFSLQWGQEFTEAGDFYLYIPEGVVVDAENVNCINAAIEAVITVEGGSVEPATPLAVVNVTVGEDVMSDLSAIVAAPETMIKVNFDGKFYFQGEPSIVDAEGEDASSSFDYMNGLDVDGSNSYIFMGKKEGTYTITLAKAQFNELEMMGWKAPAEDIVLTVQIAFPNGIDNITVDADAVIYDLSGRRVNVMTKGIYIVNGKKVIKK